jgi:hypothetical protein
MMGFAIATVSAATADNFCGPGRVIFASPPEEFATAHPLASYFQTLFFPKMKQCVALIMAAGFLRRFSGDKRWALLPGGGKAMKVRQCRAQPARFAAV